MKRLAFLLLLLLPMPNEAQLPLALLPAQVDTVTELKITVVKPGRWPWNPFKRAAMKRRGEVPQSRMGRTIHLRIEGRTEIKR